LLENFKDSPEGNISYLYFIIICGYPNDSVLLVLSVQTFILASISYFHLGLGLVSKFETIHLHIYSKKETCLENIVDVSNRSWLIMYFHWMVLKVWIVDSSIVSFHLNMYVDLVAILNSVISHVKMTP
jgi:hypothetical protein